MQNKDPTLPHNNSCCQPILFDPINGYCLAYICSSQNIIFQKLNGTWTHKALNNGHIDTPINFNLKKPKFL